MFSWLQFTTSPLDVTKAYAEFNFFILLDCFTSFFIFNMVQFIHLQYWFSHLLTLICCLYLIVHCKSSFLVSRRFCDLVKAHTYSMNPMDSEFVSVFSTLWRPGVVCESGGHLPVDQLPVCLPVRHRIRGGELLHHSGGDEEDEEGEGRHRGQKRLLHHTATH